MSQIIPSSQIAALLEEKASLDAGTGIEVVRAVFSLIEEQLAAGHNVNIKKLGRFVLTDNEEKPIRFVPDTEYKAVVNAPFEAFEPFHLFADEVEVVEEPEQAELSETEEPQQPATQQEEIQPLAIDEPDETPGQDDAEEVATEEDCNISIDEEIAQDIPEPVIETEPETEPELPPVPATMPPPLSSEEPPKQTVETPPPLASAPPPPPATQPQAPDGCSEPPVVAKRHLCGWQCFWLAIAFIVGLFIGFALGYFNASTIIESFTINDCSAPPTAVDTVPRVGTDTIAHLPADSAQTANAQTSDTASKAVSAPPARAPRYDTITRTTFLTTLARRYYGQMEYWVYIYDANKLGNPNTIAPGTTLLIPYPDQLPLTGNTEADIKAAKKRSAEIYARYK